MSSAQEWKAHGSRGFGASFLASTPHAQDNHELAAGTGTPLPPVCSAAPDLLGTVMDVVAAESAVGSSDGESNTESHQGHLSPHELAQVHRKCALEWCYSSSSSSSDSGSEDITDQQRGETCVEPPWPPEESIPLSTPVSTEKPQSPLPDASSPPPSSPILISSAPSLTAAPKLQVPCPALHEVCKGDLDARTESEVETEQASPVLTPCHTDRTPSSPTATEPAPLPVLVTSSMSEVPESPPAPPPPAKRRRGRGRTPKGDTSSVVPASPTRKEGNRNSRAKTESDKEEKMVVVESDQPLPTHMRASCTVR